MMSLSGLDFVLVGLYFLVLILIGYFTSRKKDDEEFLIAKRGLGGWSTMMTTNASKTGSVMMIFTALVFLWGISAIWSFIGMVIGMLIFLPFAMKLKDESAGRYYTLADYFKYNYGKKAAGFASLITIVVMVGYLVMNLIAGTKIFVFFTAWPFWICAVIMMFVVLIYLLMGGFKAVAKTDILQYLAMIFILAVLALILFQGSLVPVSEWNVFRADIGTIIGFFIIGLFYPFAAADMWQRVYSAKNKKALRNGILSSLVVYAIFGFLLALVALTVKGQFPGIDPDLALIYGFANLLPVGLLGLAVVLLFAAVMSSIDTYIFTGASAVVQDWFDWDKKKTVRNIRKVIFGLAVLATILAIVMQDLVVSTYIFVSFIIVLAVCVIATWARKNIKSSTLVSGFFVGLVGIIGLLSYYLLVVGEVQPVLVIAGLGLTIVGLLIGGIYSWAKK